MKTRKRDTRRNDGAAGVKRDRYHEWMRRRWEQRAAQAAARRAAEGGAR